MSLAKKKKLVRRERQKQLKERVRLIQSLLKVTADEQEVEYVLPDNEDEADTALGFQSAGETGAENVRRISNSNMKGNDEEDEDRVQLPSLTVTDGQKAAARGARRQKNKMSWEALKLGVAERYGPEVGAIVSEHDGNAEDPFFTVQLKSVRRTVPVPQHWNQLRAFLANQADRERGTDIVPPEIAALGVERIRATRDKKANPDQIAFVTCFISGTPLQRKRFSVDMSRAGEIFYEGRWLPKVKHEPGALSQRLRAALGMGPHSPPPWLYGMQAMRRLPPAYPSLKVPGLNAPIPPGAQWGNGEGQWGQPPRNENNTFLFPGVMDEVAAEEAPPVYWGTVPPLVVSAAATSPREESAALPSSRTAATAASAAASAKSMMTPKTTAPPTITPVPFHPQSYTPAAAIRYTPATTQEYVRVQDGTAGATVALGSVLVPKTAATAAAPVTPSPQQLLGKLPVPPQQLTKF